jgi:hypothetical protein
MKMPEMFMPGTRGFVVDGLRFMRCATCLRRSGGRFAARDGGVGARRPSMRRTPGLRPRQRATLAAFAQPVLERSMYR